MADAQWKSLPAHFRVQDGLRNHSHSPFQRDFMASIRLNHLHVSFLLCRLRWDRLSEPNASLIEVAIEMLKLVVGLVLLREELSNSGTNLPWKVCV